MAKILLVEDDNNLREIYEARLQAEGYDIVAAPDGETALAVAKQEMPDLVISDVMMPRISGFEMLDILRNTEGLKDVKVIMLTALGQAEDKTRADKLGADRYLVKSQVTLEDIVKSAGDLLGQSGATMPAAAAPAPEPAAPAPAPAAAAPAPQPAPAAAPMPAPQPAPAPPAPVAPTPAAPTPAPAPATPAPTPLSIPPLPPAAPATPAPVPAPVAPAPVAPPAATPPTPAPVPAPVTPPAPPATPSPSAAAGGSEQMMADAVKDLLNGPAAPAPAVSAVAPTIPAPAPAPAAPAAPATPAPTPVTPPAPVAPVAPAPTPPAPAVPEVPAPPISPIPAEPAKPEPTPEPTPEVPAKPASDDPTPADGRTDADSDGVIRKKVIKPLEHPADKAQAPDLNALLAKEGITDFDKDEQPSAPAHNGPSFNDVPAANNATHADLPHPPGHVISPNPVSADGKPVDPNSISL